LIEALSGKKSRRRHGKRSTLTRQANRKREAILKSVGKNRSKAPSKFPSREREKPQGVKT